jgi:hypothetical protein
MSINSISLDYPIFFCWSLYLLKVRNFLIASIFLCCQYPAEHSLPLVINSFRKLLSFISSGFDLILPILAGTTEENIDVATLSNIGLNSLFWLVALEAVQHLLRCGSSGRLHIDSLIVVMCWGEEKITIGLVVGWYELIFFIWWG